MYICIVNSAITDEDNPIAVDNGSCSSVPAVFMY